MTAYITNPKLFAKKGEIGLLEGAQVVNKAIEIIKSEN